MTRNPAGNDAEWPPDSARRRLSRPYSASAGTSRGQTLYGALRAAA